VYFWSKTSTVWFNIGQQGVETEVKKPNPRRADGNARQAKIVY